MTRTVGAARMVIAAMVLMGGGLGVFGDVKTAAVNQTFPRVPRTEQEQAVRMQKGNAMPAAEGALSFVARGRSRDGDPCVPSAPAAFSARGAMIC